jgi:hypothetical protein
LKVEKKHEAIHSLANVGTNCCDIGVSDNCSTNTGNATYLGSTYINDIGLDGGTFFTGSERFKMKEIELFEITDCLIPPKSCLPAPPELLLPQIEVAARRRKSGGSFSF